MLYLSLLLDNCPDLCGHRSALREAGLRRSSAGDAAVRLIGRRQGRLESRNDDG
jgi:hypothetical protein